MSVCGRVEGEIFPRQENSWILQNSSKRKWLGPQQLTSGAMIWCVKTNNQGVKLEAQYREQVVDGVLYELAQLEDYLTFHLMKT